MIKRDGGGENPLEGDDCDRHYVTTQQQRTAAVWLSNPEHLCGNVNVRGQFLRQNYVVDPKLH